MSLHSFTSLVPGYTSQGGSALVAVEGLTSLLNDTRFFEADVLSDHEDGSREYVECSTRLTLLDLAIQVVCDVATSSARETYFRSCVDFVSDAVRYAGGKLNNRTIGFVLRFYLFVFYFGASIPSTGWPFEKDWRESNSGLSEDVLLSDDLKSENNHGLIGVYLPGGAPQAAAIALKELVSIMLGRLGVDVRLEGERNAEKPPDSQGIVEAGDFENSIDGVDLSNLTQLAWYQIHRSGGSELFW